MNIYLLSVIEVILYSCAAYFLGQQIMAKTFENKAVKLNYILWGVIILCSLLINFHLYLYFGSVFVIGVITIFIYIYKVLGVEFFLSGNMKPMFWLLFVAFIITLLVTMISKRVLISSKNSEPSRGITGHQGKIGVRGKSYFIESMSEKLYVVYIEALEKYFKQILDKNEIPYDKHKYQFNNIYLKNLINRICHSEEMMTFLIGKYRGIDGYDTQCSHITSPSVTGPSRSNRKCRNKKDKDDALCNTDDALCNTDDALCNTDDDCSSKSKTMTNLNKIIEDIYLEEDKVSDDDKEYCIGSGNINLIKKTYLELKLWINMILLNSCEENKKLEKSLNLKSYETLNNRLGDSYNRRDVDNNLIDYVSNKKITPTDIETLIFKTDPDATSKCYYKKNERNIDERYLGSLNGRRFLQSYIYNKNHFDGLDFNPFRVIELTKCWSYGNPEGKIPNTCYS